MSSQTHVEQPEEEASRGADSDASPVATAPKPPSLFRNRDYLLLWSGDAISMLGTSMSTIGYPLLILFTSGSVAGAGIVSGASFVGSIATTLVGGALADRVSRRAILALTAVAQAVVGGIVAWAVVRGHSPVWLLAGAAAAAGLAAGLEIGARTPALRRIVPKHQLTAAAAQTEGRDLAAQLVGNPLGSILFTIAHWIPFAADAVSFLFAAAGAVAIRRPLGPDRVEKPERSGLLADLAAGLKYVRKVPFLRFIALWAAATNMALAGYSLLFIVMLRYRGAGPTTIGFLSSVVLLGGVAGAVVAQLVVGRLGARVVFLAGSWAFAGGLFLTAVLPQPWEIACASLLVTLAFVPMVAAISAYDTRIVPDEFSGRASSAMSFSNKLLQWAGPLGVGFVASALGPPAVGLILGTVLAALAVVCHLAPSLRLLNTPVDQLAEIVP